MNKGLEELEKIKNWLYTHDLQALCDIDTIEKELKEGEKAQFKLKALGNFVKKDKALEIIKEKLVNLFHLVHTDTKEAYNDLVSEHYRELTQEEYDLIKEVVL